MPPLFSHYVGSKTFAIISYTMCLVFLHCHFSLQNYYKPLLALSSNVQPVCTQQEVKAIFSNIEELYTLHTVISLSLDPLLESNFESLEALPSIFRTLVSS